MESKKLPAPVVVPTEIQELSCQIEQWSTTRPYHTAMPEWLWTLSANLAKQYGLARVARFLRLDYYSLKERVGGLDRDNVAAVMPLIVSGAVGLPWPLVWEQYVCSCARHRVKFKPDRQFSRNRQQYRRKSRGLEVKRPGRKPGSAQPQPPRTETFEDGNGRVFLLSERHCVRSRSASAERRLRSRAIVTIMST